MTEVGKKTIYSTHYTQKGMGHVILWDVLDLGECRAINVHFEEALPSGNRQGIWFQTDKGLMVEGQKGPSVYLWFDTAPRPVRIDCESSDGLLSIYNVWERPNGQVMSQGYTSGMIREQLCEQRWRYRCQDTGPDPEFSSLVFSLEILVD